MVTHPPRFDSKVVAFEGRIRSDGVHMVGADDLQCPGKLVRLLLPRPVSNADGIDALRRAIYSGHPGTIDKDIFARVIGVMRVRAEGKPPLSIEVTKVENIKVVKKSL